MSDQLMDTSPGGETPQYESIKTVTNPTAKSGGQMGVAETEVSDTTQTSNEATERGEKTADNIRYGQNISESGMGGMTTTSTGEANQDGFEETAASGDAGDVNAAGTRAEQGYSKGEDMDREIGA